MSTPRDELDKLPWLERLNRVVDDEIAAGRPGWAVGYIVPALIRALHEKGVLSTQERDGVFTAMLTPSDDDLDRWTGLIRVKVYGETSSGDRRSARTRFYYGTASAWLTGNYRDELAGGHLRLLAEVQVTAPAEYRLDATLS